MKSKWQTINYDKVASGAAPFNQKPVLVGDAIRIGTGIFLPARDGYSAGWRLFYPFQDIRKDAFWTPIPDKKSAVNWALPSIIKELSIIGVGFGKRLLIQVPDSENKPSFSSWIEAYFDKKQEVWQTPDGHIIKHISVLSGLIIDSPPVLADTSSIHGLSDQIWS